MRRGLPVRPFVAAAVSVGVASTVAVVAQAVLVGGVIARVVLRGETWPNVLRTALLVAGLAGTRAALAWVGEMLAHRTAATVKSTLRADLLEAVLSQAPNQGLRRPAGEIAAVAGRGLDSLDSYFSRFLPDLVLAAVAPLGILAWMASFDPVSAASLAVVAALVPVFGVLLGLAARARAESQWRQLASFAGHFLDVVNGLPTLRALNRAAAQADGIASVGETLRRRTMATLRVAFLSALALEVLAAVGTALVAVGVGLRLLDGHASLGPALAVLMVAPEVFLPLRRASAQFHASAEGLAALETAFDVIGSPPVGRGPQGVPDGRGPVRGGRRPAQHREAAMLQVEGLTIAYAGRSEPVLAGVDLTLGAGECVMLQGVSGAGKSTLVHAVLGFVTPDEGRVVVGGADLASADLQAVRQSIAWVPQRPHLFSGSVAENIALGCSGATRADIQAAAEIAGALGFIESLPHGFETVLGENGLTLSGGERQRVALARALVRKAPLVILDEPTSALDRQTEWAVVSSVASNRAGAALLVASHRPAWAQVADRVLTLQDGLLTPSHGAAVSVAV